MKTRKIIDLTEEEDREISLLAATKSIKWLDAYDQWLIKNNRKEEN